MRWHSSAAKNQGLFAVDTQVFGGELAIFSEHSFIPSAYKAANAEKAITLLLAKGYKPLIAHAKDAYYQVLGAPIPPKERFLRSGEEYEPSMAPPLAGELFKPKTCDGIFYVALFGDGWGSSRLQVGCIGPADASGLPNEFRRFAYIVRKSYPNRGKRKWRPYSLISSRFNSVLKDAKIKLVVADQVTSQELSACRPLEDSDTRSWALRIKASGGVIESELIQKFPGDSSVLQVAIAALDSAALLTRQYVVICKKTSNRVNRFDDREQLEKMSTIGAKCSCGAPLSEERIEQFIGPTPLLSKLLTGSYWMTSRLVAVLKGEGIPGQRIALNVQDGSEEVDAFVDINANLIMFELKDKEFSMGHAYSFGARLALNKPEYAVIVATKGVAPEVKEHFERIQPEAEIVYIEKLNDLQPVIAVLSTRIRSGSAFKLLARFEPLARIEMPLANTFGMALGLDKDVVRSAQAELSARNQHRTRY